VQIRRTAKGSEHFFVADSTGYVLHVTGHGPTIEAARAAAYRRTENVVIPRMFYRADIGERFLLTERTRLEALGCL
jgi:phosphoribosylamine-glycine ligase